MLRSLRLALWCVLLAMAAPVAAAPLDQEIAALVPVASPDAPEVIGKLRQLGPAALDALLSRRDDLKIRLAETMSADDAANIEHELQGLDQIIDQVGGQRYCARSRLFWYTDLEAAKAAAKGSGKPILSLRMLGNLTDELSCANSRFFRTTLYANEGVSHFLRENFILHWQSVRPVPVVTIDFGDGRKLRRTLTGNSIHYVLTADGGVVDALPGLYGPEAFLSKLTQLADVARQAAEMASDERPAWLAQFHQQQLAALSEQWASDWQRISTESAAAQQGIDAAQPSARAARAASQPSPAAPPVAIAAAKIARPKAEVELPVLRGIAARTVTNPEDLSDDAAWQRIAALHQEDARLDAASRELIASENPTAAAAGRLAITKRRVEDPMLRLVRTLESSIAVDTVRNEYQLHRRIHQWLADPSLRSELDAFNDRVYAEIFLTPKSDPWLGLAPADAYTALPNSGVVDEGSGAARK